MSLFSDNITTPSPIEGFHNLLIKWYTDNLPHIFKENDGNITATEQSCQFALRGMDYRFKEFDMYHPMVIAHYVVDASCFSSISLSIIYSESPDDPLPSPDNLFLHLKLPVPSL
jgi:hypothetical protein